MVFDAPQDTRAFVEFTIYRHISEIYDDPERYGEGEELLEWVAAFKNIAEEHNINWDAAVNSECLSDSIERMNELAREWDKLDLKVELTHGTGD